jgi:hypothetical protein
MGSWKVENDVNNKDIADFMVAHPQARASECVEYLLNKGLIDVTHTHSDFSGERSGLPPGDGRDTVMAALESGVQERITRWNNILAK